MRIGHVLSMNLLMRGGVAAFVVGVPFAIVSGFDAGFFVFAVLVITDVDVRYIWGAVVCFLVFGEQVLNVVFRAPQDHLPHTPLPFTTPIAKKGWCLLIKQCSVGFGHPCFSCHRCPTCFFLAVVVSGTSKVSS